MIKVGVDIVFNRRFEKLIENEEFLKRVFNAREAKDKKKLIGKFALKEATMKAIGRKLNWKDIEIKGSKQPEIVLPENIKPKNFKGIEGSVSHDGEYTIGVVMIELD